MNVEETSRHAIQTFLDYWKEWRLFSIDNQSSNILSQVTNKGTQIAAVIQHMKYQEVYVVKTYENSMNTIESVDTVSYTLYLN